MRLTHQNHLHVRLQLQQAAEGAERFGDALIRLQKSEDADQRRSRIDAEPLAVEEPVGIGQPGPVGDYRDRACKSGIAHGLFHAMAVNNDALRLAYDAPQHRHAFVIGTAFQCPDVFHRVVECRGAAIEFHLAQIGIPIAAADGNAGNQMVEIGLMQHGDTGRLDGLVVDKRMVRIIADLVERNVEAGRIEPACRLGEHRYLGLLVQRVQQCGRIVGDAALHRRQRREESQPHG